MSILLPVFAMFLLTAVCTVRLGFLRFGAIRRGEIDPRYFRVYQDYDEPEKLRVHSRHLVNLFELPVLFYVITIIAFVMRQNGVLPIVLAWLYVLLRFAHTFVHLTSNNVRLRFLLFATSSVLLFALWSVIFVAIVLR